MEERYLSTEQFAKILNVTKTTVLRWIRSGKITAYNLNGRYRIPASEIEKLLKKELATSPLQRHLAKVSKAREQSKHTHSELNNPNQGKQSGEKQ